MLRFCSLVGLVGIICFAGCRPPTAESNKASAERLHTKGGPNGDLVGSPTGLSGQLQIVAASDFVVPKTPEELLAQVLRAIKLEDFDAMNELFYGSNNIRSVEELRESFEDLVIGSNKMGLDKDRWGMKRLVLSPLTEPIRADFLRGEGGIGGVPFVRMPLPTHEITFEYDWKARPFHGDRMSSYWIGEKDGTWFISTSQRVASKNK